MLGLYYRIWVDFIKRIKSQQPANRHNWEASAFICMTMAMAMNLVLIMTILEKYILQVYFYKLEFTYLPLRINNVVNYLLLFILPCVAVNYFLIFRSNRYKKLLVCYPYYNGKLFITYFLISMMLPIALLWTGIIFFSD